MDVRAWNVNIDADIRQTFLQEGADKLDIIFGPLYTKQVKHLGEFARKNNIRVVIPFSINGNEVAENPFVYQVYQSPEELNSKAISSFLARFADYHPVIIDCNDKTSNKGIFTFGLREQLEKRNIEYSITNLTSSDELFAKAFSLDKPNVVILNTGRSPELTAVFKKLDVLTQNNRNLRVSMYGYTDWLLYERINKERFFQYDAKGFTDEERRKFKPLLDGIKKLDLAPDYTGKVPTPKNMNEALNLLPFRSRIKVEGGNTRDIAPQDLLDVGLIDDVDDLNVVFHEGYGKRYWPEQYRIRLYPVQAVPLAEVSKGWLPKEAMAVEKDVTGVGTSLSWKEAGYAHGSYGFSAAAFSYKAHNLTVVDFERYSAHSFS